VLGLCSVRFLILDEVKVRWEKGDGCFCLTRDVSAYSVLWNRGVGLDRDWGA
jgi:hypothetical protein